MNPDVLGPLAATYGVIMAIAPTLQIRRMLQTRSAKDVSVGYFALLMPGFVLWIAYGVSRDDWPLIVPNTVALGVGLLTIGLATVLKRRAAHDDDAVAG